MQSNVIDFVTTPKYLGVLAYYYLYMKKQTPKSQNIQIPMIIISVMIFKFVSLCNWSKYIHFPCQLCWLSNLNWLFTGNAIKSFYDVLSKHAEIYHNWRRINFSIYCVYMYNFTCLLSTKYTFVNNVQILFERYSIVLYTESNLEVKYLKWYYCFILWFRYRYSMFYICLLVIRNSVVFVSDNIISIILLVMCPTIIMIIFTNVVLLRQSWVTKETDR